MPKKTKRLTWSSLVSFLAWIAIVCIWFAVFYYAIFPMAQTGIPRILQSVGFWGEDIKISGTGSMYPTFPKGIGENDVVRASQVVELSSMKRYPGGIVLFNTRYLGHTIMRGDIISFEDSKTREISKAAHGQEAGFVKRVVGVPGDTIEIRDGFVYLNGVRQTEPYTARARSTFGGTFAPDCSKMVVPPGKVFVLGDNRTASTDSRYELGFVDIKTIDHVLSLDEQSMYRSRWRDASKDDELLAHPTLESDRYIELLNEKRKQAGLHALVLKSALVSSAQKRGRVILETNDVSFEATRSGYTIEKAFVDAGYRNITWGEAPTVGFYTAEELIENSFQFPKTKEFLLNPDFQHIGVAAVLGDMNGCPTQVVVQHFGGFVPPDYEASVVESWKKAYDNLVEVKPGWEELKTLSGFYDDHKDTIDRIVTIINTRIARIGAIVSRMKANAWLTDEEKKFIEEDKALYEEQTRLAKQLNNQ